MARKSEECSNLRTVRNFLAFLKTPLPAFGSWKESSNSQVLRGMKEFW